MNDDQLAQIMAEIRIIISTYNVRVIVVYWNTQYVHHEEFMPEDVLSPQFSLDARGGGGTGFYKVWEWIDEQDEIDPKGIVFFTDCETGEWPEEEPDCPVVWAQVAGFHGSYINSYVRYMPDYGVHVKIPVLRGGA